MRHPFLLSSTLLTAACLCASPLASAADAFNDLRLNIGIDPGLKTATLDTSNGSEDSDGSAKTSYGVAVGVEHGEYVSGPWGWVAGADLFYKQQKGDFNGTSLKSNAFGIEINAGGAYKITDDIHLELTPFIGIGDDTLKTSDESGHGLYLAYGIDLAGFYAINAKWLVGLDVGYEGSKSKAKADYLGLGSNQDATVKASGVDAGITLGYRF